MTYHPLHWYNFLKLFRITSYNIKAEVSPVPGLFSPIEIKGKRIRNRVVLPPMATGLADDEGGVTDALIVHYRARAQAGIGLVIVEHSFVTPKGRLSKRQLGIYDDRLIPGLRALSQAIKAEGAFAAIQINHAGSAASPDIIGGVPEAPSPIAHPRRGTMPRELTQEEVSYLARAFGAAASRAKEAGFDAVEIHGAHGFLLTQFYSPLSNRRTDEYGGDRERRLRFPLQVVKEVKAAVGPDFPVFYRLGASDYMPGGLVPEDGQYAARSLEEAGIDVIDISGAFCGSEPPGPEAKEQGYFLPLAAAIKPVVRVPVIITGGIREPHFADGIIREGKADFIGIGRPLFSGTGWMREAIAALNGQG